MGTEDLDEAYGQCPARPDQSGACVVAWLDPVKGWRYAEAKGLVFGLSAAVVGFNRWPALMTAVSRRMLAILGTNYFDDFCVLSALADAVSARNGLRRAAALCGGSFGTAKTVPPGTQRAFIGVYTELGEVATDGTLTFRPRDDCINSIVSTASQMLSVNKCSPGEASKLRGKSGWASTSLFARLGRLGLAALKSRQYSDESHDLTIQLTEALKFLQVIDRIPPRVVRLAKSILPPMVP